MTLFFYLVIFSFFLLLGETQPDAFTLHLSQSQNENDDVLLNELLAEPDKAAASLVKKSSLSQFNSAGVVETIQTSEVEIQTIIEKNSTITEQPVSAAVSLDPQLEVKVEQSGTVQDAKQASQMVEISPKVTEADTTPLSQSQFSFDFDNDEDAEWELAALSMLTQLEESKGISSSQTNSIIITDNSPAYAIKPGLSDPLPEHHDDNLASTAVTSSSTITNHATLASSATPVPTPLSHPQTPHAQSSEFNSELFVSPPKRLKISSKSELSDLCTTALLSPTPSSSNFLTEDLVSPSSVVGSDSTSGSDFSPSSNNETPIQNKSSPSESGLETSPDVSSSPDESNESRKRFKLSDRRFLDMDAEDEDGDHADNEDMEIADSILEEEMADLLDTAEVPVEAERQTEMTHAVGIQEDAAQVAALTSRFVSKHSNSRTDVPDFMKLTAPSPPLEQPNRRRKRSQLDQSLLESFDEITHTKHFSDSDSEEKDEEAMKEYQERVRLKYMVRSESGSLTSFEHDQKSQHSLSKVHRQHPRLQRTPSGTSVSFAAFNETLQSTKLQRQHSLLSRLGNSKDRERLQSVVSVVKAVSKKTKSFVFTRDESRDSFPSFPAAPTSSMSAPKLQRSKSLGSMTSKPALQRIASNSTNNASRKRKLKSSTLKSSKTSSKSSLGGALFSVLAKNRFKNSKKRKASSTL